MKHLFEYINRNYNDIYENFVVTDHILTEKEINDSFNHAINEGFWAWLGDLIKSMFTDSSKETKDYGESVFKYYDDNFDKKVADYNTKLFKEKDVDKFIALVDEMYQELIDKKILDEADAIKWAIGNLSIKGRILTDEGKNSDVQKIKDKIDEYSKKNKKAAQEFTDEIKKQQEEQKKDEVQAPSEEFEKAMTESLKKYENQIKQISKTIKTTPENLKNVVYTLANQGNDTKNISDPNVIFAMITMAVGGYLTKGFQDRKLTINIFIGTLALLAKDNFKNINMEQK